MSLTARESFAASSWAPRSGPAPRLSAISTAFKCEDSRTGFLLSCSHDHGGHRLSLRYGTHRADSARSGSRARCVRHPKVELRSCDRTMRIEYDATRLNAAAVTKLVREAGLDIAEEEPILPAPAPVDVSPPAAWHIAPLLESCTAASTCCATGSLLHCRSGLDTLTVVRRLRPEARACAPVAQLDRATDYESVGREFESLRAHHLTQANEEIRGHLRIRLGWPFDICRLCRSDVGIGQQDTEASTMKGSRPRCLGRVRGNERRSGGRELGDRGSLQQNGDRLG